MGGIRLGRPLRAPSRQCRLHADDVRGFAIYGIFAAAVREHIVSRPRVLTWMRRTFAAAFVALGLRLALTERA